MAHFDNDDNSLKANESYGFKANLRHQIMDIVRRNDFLENLNIPYAITVKGMLSLMGGLAVPIVICVSFLVRDWVRAKFVGVGVVAITIAICIIVILASLTMPSYGSLLRSGIVFGKQIIKRILIKTGLKKAERKTNMSPVRSDGVVLMTNGDYGRLFKIDGRSSRTAYPSEIVEQEKIMESYHRGRSTSTTETHLTVSQRQNTEKQLEHLEVLANSTNKQANFDLINLEHRNLSRYINGVKPVSEHYLLMSNPNEVKLNESIERMMEFYQVNNMYNSVIFCTKEETEEFFNDFFKLR